MNTDWTRNSRAGRANRPLRVGLCNGLAAALLLAAACGKKGPPLVPFSRVPAAVTTVTPQRIGDDVYVSIGVPSTNADGQKPATIGSLEIYAITSERAPETKKQRDAATLVLTVPVRPILPEPPVPANGSPAPAIPLPPGVDQGATIVVRETLTPQARVPVELPADKKATKVPMLPPPRAFYEDEASVVPPLVAPPPVQQPQRRYIVIGVSPSGRESLPSTPAAVPLESTSSAPGAPVITYTETEMTLKWSAPPEARTSTFLLPPAVKPVAGANATPSTVTPLNVSPGNVSPPAPPPPLTVKSLGFNTQATTYQVFDVTPPPKPLNTSPEATPLPPPPDPWAIQLPAPLPQPTAVPVAAAVPGTVTPAAAGPGPSPPTLPTDTEFLIRGVTFGVERCFNVRPVDLVFGATVVGPASPTTCITPQDTFPPAAPRSLAAIAGAGVISLIWDANTESDIAGYIVLRGEAPGATLQAITPEPVTVTSYRDETVKPGIRYVYAVVAVDTAMPQNVSPQSNRAEETARQ